LKLSEMVEQTPEIIKEGQNRHITRVLARCNEATDYLDSPGRATD
jgi:hypothetical protein